MRVIISVFLWFSLTVSSNAQTLDTTQVLTLEAYLDWVRAYHPVMQQAGLLDAEARANILKARGGFDPKWFADYDAKSFDAKNYFREGNAGMKIPTWYGVDFEVSYNWADGIFLNPENNLPDNGQLSLKVEVPLLQGLMFDERRAQVQQARFFTQINDAERRILINDLLLDATEAYWDWVFAAEVLKVYQMALNLSNVRFENTKLGYEQGDKPAIDTLEAMIQVQNRTIDLDQAQLDYENAQLKLSNFLWFDDLVPLEITDDLKPIPLPINLALNAFLATTTFDNFENTHPELRQLRLKQSQLEVKERLKRELFKPNLRVSYNFLGDGFNLGGNGTDDFNANQLLTENYKFGVKFSYPLLLRKERAGLELVRIEQLQTNYKLSEKQLDIRNKIAIIIQQLSVTNDQIDVQNQILQNYQRLFDAENEKFRIGESSIFLLNSREQKLIDTNLKLKKLQSKYQILKQKLIWASGNLE